MSLLKIKKEVRTILGKYAYMNEEVFKELDLVLDSAYKAGVDEGEDKKTTLAREIKFKAWDTFNKMWLKTYRNSSKGEIDFHISPWIGNRTPQYKVVQYTGLHDKDGKEIYEFDYCRRENEIGEIRWDDIEARFRLYFDDKKPMPRNYPLTSDLTIVGNKYET